MDAERYEQVNRIFTAARRLKGAARAAFLDESCGPDAELRQELEALLARLDGEPGAIATAAGRGALARQAGKLIRSEEDAAGPTEPLPELLGSFRILQVLGEGGMGVVYEAEQTEPVARRVALKVVKRGMDAKDLIARFEAERQALAVMDHPGIAHVHDAGTTEDGRPWFAMELVKGLPLTQYCDAQELSTRQRLELFAELCSAVQHAHQKGIIHRDLKPSNVLVTELDGRPVPKIIDFGIAKALTGSLTDKTLVTQLGQALGTPAYMAPEQARASKLDVDTRADVYALGVMLFELLVGCLPFDEYQAWDELLRSLAEGRHDTPTPSRRFAGLPGEQRSSVAQRRRADVQALESELKSDLDWIVHVAMDPVRSRRYETANGLAADVRRYLADEPVTARPPTVGYRVRKFCKRHALGVAVASVAAVLLVVSSIGMSVVWQRSEANLGRALEAEAEARKEARTAERVSSLLTDLFEISNPSEARGNSITAREVLGRGVEKIGTELSDEPKVQARLLMTLGEVHEGLGLYQDATRLEQQALEILERLHGPEDLGVAQAHDGLGNLLRMQGDFEGARRHHEAALSIFRRQLGPESLEVAMSTVGLGNATLESGDAETARRLFEEALAIHGKTVGLDSVYAARTIMNLGNVAWKLGDDAEAAKRYEEGLMILRKELGSDHPDVPQGLEALAASLEAVGNAQAALPLAREALELNRRVLGPEHPRVAGALNTLANVHSALGEPDVAEPLLREALEIWKSSLGPRNVRIVGPLVNLANRLADRGEREQALRLYEEALSIQREGQGAEHPDLIKTLNNFGLLKREMGHHEASRALREEALAIARKAYGPEHPEVASTLQGLATLEASLGNTEAARPLFEQSLSIFRAALGPHHPRMVQALGNLCKCLTNLRQVSAARPLCEEAVSVAEELHGPSHPASAMAQAQLAFVVYQDGQAAEAEALLRGALEIILNTIGPASAEAAGVRTDLVSLLRSEGRADEADALMAEAAEP